MTNPNDRPSNALLPPPENSAEVSEAFRILAEADTSEIPKMPEQMFVEHILPMLSAPAGTKVDLSRWLDVAGTPLRSIEVVDNITGDTIFRVPPLMRSLPTVFQQEMHYAEIITEAQAHENVHPAMADRYLQRQLSNARTGATLLDVDTAQQWNSIRKRYSLPLLPVVGRDGRLVEPPVAGALSSGNIELADDQDDF